MNKIITRLFCFIMLMLVAFDASATCPRCGGKGIIYITRGGSSTYGAKDSKVKCTICGQWVYKNSTHTHPCPDCRGNKNTTSRSNKNNTNSSSSSTNPVAASLALGGSYHDRNVNIVAVDYEKMKAGYKGGSGNVHTNSLDGTFIVYNPDLFYGAPKVTKDIADYGTCRVASFAGNGAAVAIMSDDYLSYQNVPTALGDKIQELVKRGCVINDIWLEDTYRDNNLKRWCLIYDGCHHVASQYCNTAMLSALKEMEDNGETIWSISCTDEGKYIIVSKESVSYSHCFKNIVAEAKNKYGKIRSAHVINPDKLIICCEEGVYFRNVPSNLADKLRTISYIPRVAKFNLHGGFFISNGTGSKFSYYM